MKLSLFLVILFLAVFFYYIGFIKKYIVKNYNSNYMTLYNSIIFFLIMLITIVFILKINLSIY